MALTKNFKSLHISHNLHIIYVLSYGWRHLAWDIIYAHSRGWCHFGWDTFESFKTSYFISLKNGHKNHKPM